MPPPRGHSAGEGTGTELLVISSFALSALAAAGLGVWAEHFLPGGERRGERHSLASSWAR
jgi:hypothetical protein